jgi:glutaredoxin 3
VKPVTIYTTRWCGHCRRAKALLDRKSIPYEEIDVGDPPALEAMIERTGGAWTVPQVFVGDHHVGGADALHALEAGGALDPLLEEGPPGTTRGAGGE